MSRETDIAWAAGIWEGEGCWNVVRRPDRHKPQVQSRLAMTDRDVVERFAAIVGFGGLRYGIQRRPNEKPLAEWYTQRRDMTRELIAMFWPYLGERRRAKAQEVLDLGEAIPLGERTTCPKGHPYDSIEKAGGHLARRCSQCRREQSRNRARQRLGIPPEKWRIAT
jgi:hypothetical protein